MNLDSLLKEDRRWAAITLVVVAIGILWTLASRAPVAANTSGAPPPSPREGFSRP